MAVVVQFAADAPLSIQCLLYVPQMSVEKMGKKTFSYHSSIFDNILVITVLVMAAAFPTAQLSLCALVGRHGARGRRHLRVFAQGDDQGQG